MILSSKTSVKSLFPVGVQGVVNHEFERDHVSFAITPEGFRFLGMLVNEKAVVLVAHFRTQIPCDCRFLT